MAIDTETKRRSVQAYTLGLMRPVADGTIEAADRVVCAWLYFRSIAPSRTVRTLTRLPTRHRRNNLPPKGIR